MQLSTKSMILACVHKRNLGLLAASMFACKNSSQISWMKYNMKYNSYCADSDK